MTTEQLTDRIVSHEAQLAAHREDIKALFKQQDTIESLAESTHEIAKSVKVLALRVDGVDTRMTGFEDERKKRGFALWQVVMSAIAGGGITYVVSLMSQAR